jgi:hypothetical protein
METLAFPLLVAMQPTCTQQDRVMSVSMKPIVVLGMAQPYPGYDCEEVTIVASRIPDTIVAFGQTHHNIISRPIISHIT